MADVKASTFPAVLKEYLPEYEPFSHRERVSSSKTNNAEKSPSPKRSESRTKSSNSQRSNSSKKNSGDDRRRRNVEKYEKLSDNWDQAKKDVRDEHAKRLNEKIGLQHELIKVQEELSRQKKEAILQEQIQLKESERSKKHSQQVELQKICKESLANDRKNSSKSKSDTNHDQENSAPSNEAKELTTKNNDIRNIEKASKPLEKRRSITQNVKPMSPSQEMMEEQEEDDGYMPTSIPENVPWHHAQLYHLYGSNADYFLHPKLEPQPQKDVLPSKERLEGHMHVGAEDLWLSLRNESNYKLLEEDLAIPKELKNSYSAFVRQCLSKNKKPVKRNFYATEDVPEMNRLLDKSHLIRAHNLRHKTEIMYRSSLTNKDRTEVLMFNNPIPDLNNLKGEQSVVRYMPSWIDDASVTSEASYMKWIESNDARLKGGEDANRDQGVSKETHILSSSNEDSEWKFLNLHPRKPKPAAPKYHFLTDKEARCKGNFTQRYADQRESKNIPKPADVELDRNKAQSEMGFSISQNRVKGSRTPQSAPALTKQEVHNWYTSHWEPLSMHALEEYKQWRETAGQGSFSQGRTKMWPITT